MFGNASSRPQVITGIRLTDFIQQLLSKDSQATTLVVCATKERFTEQLLAACGDTEPSNIDEQQPSDGEPAEPGPAVAKTHDLLKPLPLLQLANSRTVKLVFCHDITHLRAYLATLAVPNRATRNDEVSNQESSLLAILNPIDNHRFTSSFSAQGLNRTFSLAVEAARATHRRLLMVEFPECQHREAEDFADEYGHEIENVRAPPPENAWDEEVSILNVTTKSFGAGGRGWVGRTVTIRRIAERWCAFSSAQHQREGS